MTETAHKLTSGDWASLISSCGANILSLTHKGREIMWQGFSPWPKRGGYNVIFPFFSAPAEQYALDGMVYPLPRHGLLREKTFDVVGHSGNEALILQTAATQETHKFYPFAYTFSAAFDLSASGLKVTLTVGNDDVKPMLFSLASHPGFVLPLSDAAPNDVYGFVRFENDEDAKVWMPDETGFHGFAAASPIKKNVLALTPELFAKDGVFMDSAQKGSGFNSRYVDVLAADQTSLLRMSIENFSGIGIWSKPERLDTGKALLRYVCLEPVSGLVTLPRPSAHEPPRRLEVFENLISLPPKEKYAASYRIELPTP